MAAGERAYWGASHGLLIDDFYRHVRAGKRFWIDAPAALETPADHRGGVRPVPGAEPGRSRNDRGGPNVAGSGPTVADRHGMDRRERGRRGRHAARRAARRGRRRSTPCARPWRRSCPARSTCATRDGEPGRSARAQGGRREHRRGPPAPHLGADPVAAARGGPAAPVRERALAAFSLLADAEARVHGRSPRRRALPRGGFVGLDRRHRRRVAAALADLGVERVVDEPGRAGIGPGPLRPRRPAGAGARGPRAGRGAGGCSRAATASSRRRPGWPWYGRCPDECGALPPLTVSAVGIGAGGRDVAGRANVVRVVIGEPGGADRSTMWVLETNVDDLDPRLWPTVLSALLDAGRRGRVARADPHEEGPARPHALRARPRRRPGRAARRRAVADLARSASASTRCRGSALDAGLAHGAGARWATSG